MAHWSRANGLSLLSQNKQKAGQNFSPGNRAYFRAAKGRAARGEKFPGVMLQRVHENSFRVTCALFSDNLKS
jgi:hypothetical protein